MVMDMRNRLKEKFPTLETERLRLRKIDAGDTVALYDCINDPLVRCYTTFNRGTLLFPARLFRYFEDTYLSLRDLHFAVELKDKGCLIGVCSLQFWNPSAGQARLGYLFSPEFWNRGYATEAAQSVLKYGFETLNLRRVEARCSVHNPASEQVLRKCGFTLSEDRQGNGSRLLNDGTGEPLRTYELVRPESSEARGSICYTNEIYL